MKQRSAVFLFALLLAGLSGPAQAQTPPPAIHAGPSFKALDTDKSGHLTLEEVLAYGKQQSAKAKPFRISDADLDGDGKLTVEEQRKAGIKGLEQFGTIDLKEMDINGDGYISQEDLDEYFRRKHREAFARADANKDNKLSPSEFALFRF